jgi:hypothetical protein
MGFLKHFRDADIKRNFGEKTNIVQNTEWFKIHRIRQLKARAQLKTLVNVI